MGAFGALVMAVMRKRLSIPLLKQAMESTAKLTTFVIFNKVKQPGIVIPLIEGFLAGTFGVWLAATLLPEAITTKTIWEAASFSLVNTPLAAAMLLVVFPKLRKLQIWPTT